MKNKLNIRDEEILLMGLCRLSFDAERRVMLQALAEGMIDWTYFCSLANDHGVAALVYNNLEKLDFIRLMPRDAAEKLHNSLFINLIRNTRNIEVLAEVLVLLKKENIKTVLLKGLALEISVYGNAGLRQMTDVDILLLEEDCMKARRLLMSNGFSSLPVKSVFHKPIIANIGKHLPTLKKESFAIEFHHNLFGVQKKMLTHQFYKTSIRTEIKGETTYIPSPQLFFLYLVRHLYLHEMNNESQLRLYTDLVVLIEKYREEIISYDLLELASNADMVEILASRLEPLRDILGISFPDWLNEFIDKWYNPLSINKFIFFLKSPKNNPVINKSLLYKHTIREIPGFYMKVLYLAGDLFPSIEFMKKRYNCKSGWKTLLYYPRRWGKLIFLMK